MQTLLQKFIEQSKQSLFLTIGQALEQLFAVSRPVGVLADFGEMLVAVLFGYSELEQCVRCCDYMSLTLFYRRQFGRCVFFYEFKFKAARNQLDSAESLKSAYKMLFAAMHARDYEAELRAYDNIGQQYFEAGEINRSKYFHDKCRKGVLEPDDSPIRGLFPSMRKNFGMLTVDQPTADGRPKSPNIDYYETIPLEGSHALLKLLDKRLEDEKTDFDGIRKEARKVHRRMPGDTYNRQTIILPDKTLKSVFNGGENNIGQVRHFGRDETRWNQRHRGSIQTDNNTELMTMTHRSCNRNMIVFNKHDNVGPDTFNLQKYQTYLTETGLLLIIKKLNKCGLRIEQTNKLLADYEASLDELNSLNLA